MWLLFSPPSRHIDKEILAEKRRYYEDKGIIDKDKS